MATPFLSVGVNQFGFGILDVRFALASTNDVRELAYNLISTVCDSLDEPFGDVYHPNLTEVFADKDNPYRQFYVGYNLVWLKLSYETY